MPKSDRPLLKFGSKTITTTATTPASDYTDLLQIGCDPNTELYIDSIHIEHDTTTCNALINVFLDGRIYVKDMPLVGADARFSFGRDLMLTNPKKAILVQVKITAAGTDNVVAWVSGVEVLKYPK
jgi:hypothetical protein